ncbi:hypothetical protein IGJ55_002097 [Enterococcus sp. AZ170]
MHHYITKYKNELGEMKVVAWFQLNVFGKSYCLFKREMDIPTSV